MEKEKGKMTMGFNQAVVTIVLAVHGLFLLFMIGRIYLRKRGKSNISHIQPRQETLIWSGKVSSFNEGGHDHTGPIDAIVYSDGVFIGYAEHGFPLFYSDLHELADFWTDGCRLRLTVSSQDQKKWIAVTGERNQIEMLGKKLVFLLKRKKRMM